MCIFFISDYWGEFCKSSIKLPPQKQKVQTSRINKSTWFSQGCSKCSSHMIRPAVICSRATNWFNLLQLNLLFFSSSTFWYLEHNHKPSASGQRQNTLSISKWGKKGFVLPKCAFESLRAEIRIRDIGIKQILWFFPSLDYKSLEMFDMKQQPDTEHAGFHINM